MSKDLQILTRTGAALIELQQRGMSVALRARVAYRSISAFAVCAHVVSFSLALTMRVHAGEAADVKRQLEALERQNAALQQQVRQQQTVIETLGRRVADIEQTSAPRHRESEEKAPATNSEGNSRGLGGFNLGKVNISAEGAVAFFDTQSNGSSPNAEFRVDEAKLFLEAPVWDDVYFFSELNFATREHDDLDLRLGELYLDFENVSKLWNRDRMLNVRAGRIDVPFGEEYLSRDAIDNPLISHSLADIWGVDEGVELYGAAGKLSYVIAVQNGGTPGTRDFTADKSVAGRVAFNPARWLHLSVSGMRTGDLAAPKDEDRLSELWFGNGWFRSIGAPETTTFRANLVEGDVEMRWSRGHLKAFGGYVSYDDNDPTRDNARDIFYYSVEGVQNLTKKWYAASRFSQILADNGYPIPGHGKLGKYFFGPICTEDIWRLSLGLGYRWSDNLLIKTEYAIERGHEISGRDRSHQNMFAVEAAFKF